MPNRVAVPLQSAWHGCGTPVSRLSGVGEIWGAVRWELRLVGTVELRPVGTRTAPVVGSRKARTLVALLGSRAGRMVAIDEVVEVLWEVRRPRRPEANVATLVSRLRGQFGADVISGGRAGYRLGEQVEVDLDEAEALGAEAETLLRRGDSTLCVVAAERGLELLSGGPVLAGHPAAGWAEEARHRQVRLLRRLRLTVAEAALSTGEPERARPCADAAIGADPLDEAAYRLFMRACFAAGEPAHALLAYHRLRHVLAVELGTDPAPPTRDLYLAVLRET
jgi:DNA-binding SARP family transcriptional activator